MIKKMTKVETALKLIGMYVKGAAEYAKGKGGNIAEKKEMEAIFENAKTAMKGIIQEDFLKYFQMRNISPFEYILFFDIYQLTEKEREDCELSEAEQGRCDVGASLFDTIEIGQIEKECGFDAEGVEYFYYPQYKMLREQSSCISEVPSLEEALCLLSRIRGKGYYNIEGDYNDLYNRMIEQAE